MIKFKFNKSYLFILVFIILIISNAVGLFLISNRQQQIRIAKKNLILQGKLTQESISPQFIKESQTIDSVFPLEPEVIQFISNINRYQGAFEKLDLIFQTDEPKSDRLNFLPFTLELNGKTESVIDFIKKIEQMPLIIETTNLEAKKMPNSTDKISLILKANLYVKENYDQK
jgi:Tfp pilus assembly protein PilO